MEKIQVIIDWIKLNWETILMIAGGVATIISTVIAAIKGIIAKVKSKELKLSDAVKELAMVDIPELVKYIEQIYPQGGGEIKKDYVKKNITNYLIGKKVDVDEKTVDAIIEQCISIMNTNRRGK